MDSPAVLAAKAGFITTGGGGGVALTQQPMVDALAAQAPQLVETPSDRPAGYIIVSGTEQGNAVELPLDSNGALNTATLQIEYTGAMGIKYRNPDTGIYRILAPKEGKIHPPPDGWGTHYFIACVPKGVHERPWMDNGASSAAALGKRAFPGAAPVPAGGVSSNFAPIGAAADYGFGGPPVKLNMRRGGSFATPRLPGGPRGGGGAGRGGGGRGGSRGGGAAPPPGGGGGGAAGTYAFCDVCNVALNSKIQADMHFSGKKHLALAAGMPPPKSGGGARGYKPSSGDPAGAAAGASKGGFKFSGVPKPQGGKDYTADETTIDFSS